MNKKVWWSVIWLVLLTACSNKPSNISAEQARTHTQSHPQQIQAAPATKLTPQQQAELQARLQLMQLQQQMMINSMILETTARTNYEINDSIRRSSLMQSCAISGNCRVEIYEYPR